MPLPTSLADVEIAYFFKMVKNEAENLGSSIMLGGCVRAIWKVGVTNSTHCHTFAWLFSSPGFL